MSSTTATTPQEDAMAGVDIAAVLRSTGPVVKCVILRASNDETTNDSNKKKDNEDTSAALNEHLMEEIELDTTPQKNEVEKVLGGPFTFVGQYEEEGIMLMARRGWVWGDDDDEEDLAIAKKCKDDTEAPWNPHKLQPPFDNTKIRGDILVLKVAEVDDPLDEEANSEQPLGATPISNDEFFLNYTKEQYLAFAARTDYVPPDVPEESEAEEEEECEDDDEDDAGEWSGEEDEEDEEVDEEEAKSAMLNLVLSTCLKKFREENGRGPDTNELLAIKMTVAEKLGMDLPGMEEENDEEEEQEDDKAEENHKPEADDQTDSKESSDESDKKRKSTDETNGESPKKVKFSKEEEIVEEQPKETSISEPITVP